jgi:NADP-dependent 3-hydroxy acid dehydrogenase YdfG
MTERGVALVTGASRGIGRAIAKRLAEQWDIVAIARSGDALETLRGEIESEGGKCRAIQLDITDAAAVERALEGIEADVLVNNAGVGVLRPLLELSLEDWRNMVSLNLDALFYVTRVLLPGMVSRGSGFIVNIGSLAGRNAFVGGACYAATKHAVVAFSESLMLEVRDAGVRVATIMPGSVATEFGHPKADMSWMLTAEEVADAVWFTLQQPGNALISRVEMRPAKVKK